MSGGVVPIDVVFEGELVRPPRGDRPFVDTDKVISANTVHPHASTSANASPTGCKRLGKRGEARGLQPRPARESGATDTPQRTNTLAVEMLVRPIQHHADPHVVGKERQDAAIHKANIEMKRSQYRSAVKLYTAACFRTDSCAAFFGRAVALCMLRQFAKAEVDFTKALARPNGHKSSVVHYNRGVTRSLLQVNIQGAIEDFSRALNLDPSNQDARWNRALLYRQLGDFVASHKDYAHVHSHSRDGTGSGGVGGTSSPERSSVEAEGREVRSALFREPRERTESDVRTLVRRSNEVEFLRTMEPEQLAEFWANARAAQWAKGTTVCGGESVNRNGGDKIDVGVTEAGRRRWGGGVLFLVWSGTVTLLDEQRCVVCVHKSGDTMEWTAGRCGTAEASEDTITVSLDSQGRERCIQKYEHRRMEHAVEALRRVAWLRVPGDVGAGSSSGGGDAVLREIARSVEVVRLRTGELLVEQGQHTPMFYAVTRGSGTMFKSLHDVHGTVHRVDCGQVVAGHAYRGDAVSEGVAGQSAIEIAANDMLECLCVNVTTLRPEARSVFDTEHLRSIEVWIIDSQYALQNHYDKVQWRHTKERLQPGLLADIMERKQREREKLLAAGGEEDGAGGRSRSRGRSGGGRG